MISVRWLAAGAALTAATGVAVFAAATVPQQDSQTARATPAATSTGPVYSITGRVRLHPGEYVAEGATCRGVGNLGEVAPGGQIVVSDEAGGVLTTGSLGTGGLVKGLCHLPFALAIPTGRATYWVDVPQWGQLRYTEDQLRDMIELTYG